MVHLFFICNATNGKVLVGDDCANQDRRLLKQLDSSFSKLKKHPKKLGDGLIKHGAYDHHYMFKKNILLLAICCKYYPSKLALRFLEEIHNKFKKISGPMTAPLMKDLRNTKKLYTSSAFQINNWTSVARCSDGILYAEISDDEWTTEMKKNYTKKAVSIFLQRSEAPLQKSVIMDTYSAHCLTEEDICYMTICSKNYPVELAFEFLKDIKNEFEKKFRSKVPHAKAYGAFSVFGSFMNNTVKAYWDTRSERIQYIDVDEQHGKVQCLQLENLNDEKLKNLDNNVPDQDVDEASTPLKMADPNIKKEAVRWFWSLHCEGKGGILAHDMGLGKTRLILAFLAGLFHSNLIVRALIIVPKTIVDQWADAISDMELEKPYRIYTSPKLNSHQEGLKYIVEHGGLLVSSYPVVQTHHQAIVGNITWDYMLFDEGHRLKNIQSRTSEVLNAADCHHKIVATGTPIQNNLLEYYAIVNLCCPGLLGSETSFHENFFEPIEKGKHKDATLDQLSTAISATQALNTLVAPYLLRRTKQVLVESMLLPKKQEWTVWIGMAPLQVRLYKIFVTIPNYKISGSGLAAAKVARDICNHPLILKRSQPGERKGLSIEYVKRLLHLIPVEDDVLSSCKI